MMHILRSSLIPRLKKIRRFLKSIAGYKVSSSVHSVESNDDLLIEILLRLPVISLVLFKSVSKRWLSIITNPNFITLLRQITRKPDPVSGLYIQNIRSFCSYDFLPLDNRVDQISRSPFKIFSGYDSCYGVILLQSCHGLLLCVGFNHFYVYNPTTSLFKKIPPFPIDNGTIRMAYDPTKSPHYKLVYVRHRDYNQVVNNIQIYTYSSETGIWSDCGNRYWSKSSYLKYKKRGIYWSNAIHWVEGLNHNKLCLEDLDVTSVQAPGTNCCKHKLFESRGCLLTVCKCPHFSIDRGELKQLNVYEMSNDHCEWSIKYIVHLDEAKRSFRLRKLVSIKVWCIVLGETEEDSFMVIDLDGTIMKYKIMSNTLHKLPYSKKYRSYHPDTFQFIASFADV